ncbi:MAG: GatB/YqeY domain-containing protein [Ignavibacteriaceae bacterium]|nr:GatB/YqeY domain-containing protein [Ignavibacteriaceae bacterium]
MSLKEKINDGIKSALKNGEKVRLETLRSIKTVILEFEKSGSGRDINPDDELSMVNSLVKRRKEAIELFKAAGRIELAEKEQSELDILMEFLPKQLNESEIKDLILSKASELGIKAKNEFPKLMPAIMKELKGKAEGNLVKKLVTDYLETL